MNKKNILAIVVVLIIVVISFVFLKGNTIVPVVEKAQNISTSTNIATQITKDKVAIYNMADISLHNNSSSCWTVINGNVYDMTSFISVHLGGEKSVLGTCGIDGSVAFNKKHAGQQKAETTLATLKIGILK